MFKVEIDRENNRILHTVRGFMDKADVEAMANRTREAVAELRDHSEWFDVLADLSQATASARDGESAMAGQTAHLQRHGMRKIALVLGQGLASLQAKRYISGINGATGVFATSDEAAAWLNEDIPAIRTNHLQFAPDLSTFTL